MRQTADVVVIGGGVLGCATAYYLAKKGATVVLLEKNEICEGASSRNTGLVHESGHDPADLPLAREAMEIFANLQEELNADFEYQCTGTIILIQREEDHELQLGLMRRDLAEGIETSFLQPEDVVRIAPGFSTDVVGALWYPNDWRVNPIKLTYAYARAAARLGVEVRNHSPALAIQLKGEAIEAVQTSEGMISTGNVVNAAGAHAEQIFEMVDLRVGLPPKRSFMMITEPMPRLLDAVIGLGTGDFTAHQALDGKFHIASRGDYQFEMAGYDLRPTHRMIQWISGRMVRILPAAKEARILRAFGGLVSYADDMLPLLGPVEMRPGFFLATGFYGGVCYAPAVGKSVADHVVDGKSEINLERFSFQRLLDPSYKHTYEGILRLTEKEE